MGSQIASEDWFIFRQEAATAYLGRILREVRWKSHGDAFLERLGLSEMATLVRELDHIPYVCDCCSRSCASRRARPSLGTSVFSFRFEMDRGRPNMGHEYILEVRKASTRLWRNGTQDWEVELPAIADLDPERVLECIREVLVADVMRA